jgi:hypothetical protein
MSSTTPENAESWRDLADQLTPEQVAELDAYTHSGTRLYQLRGTAITVSAAINPGPRWVDTGPRWDDAALLSQARHHARENLTAAMVGEVPPPAGTSADAWEDNDPPYRFIRGADRAIAGTTVRVLTGAFQFADGSIDVDGQVDVPNVAIDGDVDHLSADQARQLAAAVLAAADEIDKW